MTMPGGTSVPTPGADRGDQGARCAQIRPRQLSMPTILRCDHRSFGRPLAALGPGVPTCRVAVSASPESSPGGYG